MNKTMELNLNKIIGTNIQKLRKLNNEKQKELSKILGITEQALSHYEQGIRRIKADTLIIIANKYKVSLDYFIDLTNYSSFTRKG